MICWTQPVHGLGRARDGNALVTPIAAAGVVELVAGVEVFGLDPVASLADPERMLVRGFDRLSFLRHRIDNRQDSQMRGNSPKRIEHFSSRHFPRRRIPRDDFFTSFNLSNRLCDVAG